MELPAQTERLWDLSDEQEELIHEGSDGSKIVVLKGEKVEKYGDFDIQIQLRGEGYRPDYTPSNPDVFKDLERKIRSNPTSIDRLFEIITQVYEGDSPDEHLNKLEKMVFDDEKFPARSGTSKKPDRGCGYTKTPSPRCVPNGS